MASEGEKKEYNFGSIQEFSLDEIESEVLNESVYLDVFAGSDVAFKQDIRPLEASLDQVLALNSYTYKYKTDEYISKNFPQGEQIGLMANEVEKVFPQLVERDSEGKRYLNYTQLVPVLLSGLKDLHGIVEKQGQEIKSLKKKLKD